MTDVDALHDAISQAGVLGRGGAAFPLAVKLATVRQAAQRGVDTVLVANGEEGEPASVKDRWLLRHRPHLVLDGVRLAAQIIGARHAHVYVSDERAAVAVRTALDELTPEALDGITVSMLTVAPGYVAGEETAAVRAINGGPAKPTDKPPRPFEEGVGGLPTAVSNVETLANLPYVHRHGAPTYRELGTEGSSGTFLATVTGVAVHRASTRCRSESLRRNWLRCTGSTPRASRARSWAGTSRACWTGASSTAHWTTDRCATPEAGWDVARCR